MKHTKFEAKTVLFDIENSPHKGYFYDMYKEGNIVEIIEHSFMLSFAYKWLHEDKIHTFCLPDFKGYRRNLHDDKRLVEKLASTLQEADYVVAHNGDRFDLTVTNTRMIHHGLYPLPPLKTIDTLKIARQKFHFPSNRLDDLAGFFGFGRKLPNTGKKLWLACMEGDMNAWKKMRAYNAQDVNLLEKVYLKLRPWGKHPNVSLVTRNLGVCPVCQSSHIRKCGRQYIYSASSDAQRYECFDCGKKFQGPWERLENKIVLR